MFNEAELLDSRDSIESLVCEKGTIGWEGDTDLHYDINQDADDGVTLVKVQLFRGRVPGTTAKTDAAQGHKILARLSSQHGGMWSIPRKGKQCIVEFAGGFNMTPGTGVITAIAGAYINDQFKEDREIWDAGADRDVLIKGRRVAIQGYDGSFIAISPEAGIQVVDKDGNGVCIQSGTVTIFGSSGSPPDAQTCIVVKAGEVSLQDKAAGGSFISLKGGVVGIQGNTLSCPVGQATIGVGATALTAAVHAPGGAASVPSTTVFISP